MIEIIDDESLKKENITIDKSKSDFNKSFEKKSIIWKNIFKSDWIFPIKTWKFNKTRKWNERITSK